MAMFTTLISLRIDVMAKVERPEARQASSIIVANRCSWIERQHWRSTLTGCWRQGAVSVKWFGILGEEFRLQASAQHQQLRPRRAAALT